MNIVKTIKSTALCLRFPFLYPRNRWTGLHYTNWKMWEFVGHWDSKTKEFITFHEEKNSEGCFYATRIDDNSSYGCSIEVWNDNVTIKMGRKTVWEKPFSYFGTGEIFGIKKEDENKFTLITSEDFQKSKENSWFIVIDHSKWLRAICSVVDWVHRHPVQWIHFLTDYTELDSMPYGWRKAFGIQMCKEIKTVLRKEHLLYKYRIVQIKEKFGSLRWYDNGCSEEIDDIVDKYENISWRTCIHCGEPATYISRGWISPYCSECVCEREHSQDINVASQTYDPIEKDCFHE